MNNLMDPDQLYDLMTKNTPPASHKRWRKAHQDEYQCAAVKGLRVAVQVLKLPERVIPKTDGPIGKMPELLEAYSRLCPNAAKDDMVKPFLAGAIVMNDRGKGQVALKLIWALFKTEKAYRKAAKATKLSHKRTDWLGHRCELSKKGKWINIGRRKVWLGKKVDLKKLKISESDIQETCIIREQEPSVWNDTNSWDQPTVITVSATTS